MLSKINLPSECMLQLAEIIVANPDKSDRLAAMTHAAGHSIISAAIGVVVNHIEITQEQGVFGMEWDCLVRLEPQQDQEITNLTEHEKALAAAMHFIGGYAGESLKGSNPAKSSVSDRYCAEFLCAQLDRLYKMPDHTFFNRVSNLATEILVDNLGIYAAIIDALDSESLLRGEGLSSGLATIKKVSLQEMLGGLQ